MPEPTAGGRCEGGADTLDREGRRSGEGWPSRARSGRVSAPDACDTERLVRILAAVLMALFLAGASAAAEPDLEALIWNGKAEQAIQLLEARPDLVNARLGGFTPLHLAGMVNNVGVAKYLLAHDVEVDARDFEGYSALVRARANGNLEIADLIVAHGGTELRP
ncbi:ankyrin repeat domain-containing protein [Lysobacter maris]|uniref:Ankyrin repeat domain-containing protein n=1 Tax=Marilutibacter maris TaxID=1605891 RepID=A0A508AT03_9GAMM|nr:ankyrin repeat domain-containing protein [Lysobacter maris]KAB8192949.1 ankyrin repeat domain-containing protein [Lysobacter maris]